MLILVKSKRKMTFIHKHIKKMMSRKCKLLECTQKLSYSRVNEYTLFVGFSNFYTLLKSIFFFLNILLYVLSACILIC